MKFKESGSPTGRPRENKNRPKPIGRGGRPSAEHPKSLDVGAAHAAPRCVLVVAYRTTLLDSS
jgi:hypothetical protein